MKTNLKKPVTLKQAVHAARVVASCGLLGTVIAGAFFGWAPALGIFTVHSIGALLGAGVGVFVNVNDLS